MSTFRHRSSFAGGAVVAAGSVLAACVLLACASDDDAVATVGPDAGADAQPDTSATPVEDASDAGADVTDAAIPDNRPPFDAAAPEVSCAVTPCIERLVAGPKNYCAIATDGVVRCWGQASNLGTFVDDAAPNPGATPVVIDGLGDVVDVGISNYDTCVASADGTVWCFGSSSVSPTLVPNVEHAKKLALGDDRKCAVLESGELYCWGDNYSTGFGEGIVAVGGQKAVSAALKFSNAFALGADGTLFSWGTSSYLLGRSSGTSPDRDPAPVLGLPPTLAFAASDSHACALTRDGRLFCWGRADYGALGLGYVRHEYFPVEVVFSGFAYPSKVVATQTHTCARMTDGKLTCWGGMNRQGQLGYSSTEGAYIPTEVSVLTKRVIDVAVADDSTCVVLEDGSVQCFGDNSVGQLGLSTRDTFRHPFPSTVTFP